MTAPKQRTRITRTITGRSAFGQELEQLSAKKLAAALEVVGRDAVRRCEAIVAAELVNDRIPERRNPKGSRHLLGSFRHEVIWDGRNLPVTIRLYSLANPAKVNAMESGADPHKIVAVNAAFLTFPKGNRSTYIGALGDIKFSGSRGKPQIRQAYRGSGTAMTKVEAVDHPGNMPHSMMERALNAAIDSRLAGALR